MMEPHPAGDRVRRRVLVLAVNGGFVTNGGLATLTCGLRHRKVFDVTTSQSLSFTDVVIEPAES